MAADKNISTNIKLLKEAEWDDRKLKPNYSDLLAFTSGDYIPNGFVVTVIGQDDLSKRGLWMCINKSDLSNPLSWYQLTQTIPYNQVLQIGSFTYDNVTYLATLGETVDWVFIKDGITTIIGDTDVQITAPDDTYTRVDIIVWDETNGYQVVEGTPAIDYETPNTPVGTILVKEITRFVNGDTEEVDPPDLSGYAQKAFTNYFTAINYFKELRFKKFKIWFDADTYKTYDKASASDNLILEGDFQYYTLTRFNSNPQTLNTIRGVDSTNLFINIANNFTGNVTLKHNDSGISSSNRFLLPNNTDYVLQAGEAVVLYQLNSKYVILQSSIYGIGGGGGTSYFADLLDSPYDNTLLASALNTIEAKADVVQEDIDALEEVVGTKIGNDTDIYSTPKINRIISLTQLEYDAIITPDQNTLYIVI